MRDFYQLANWKLPFQDDTLIYTRFVDFFQRENASFEYEVFFLKKYPKVLLADAGDTYLLQEEFNGYLSASKYWRHPLESLGSSRDKACKRGKWWETILQFCMDVTWEFLASLKLENGSQKFGRISNVVKAVLILPLTFKCRWTEIFFAYEEKESIIPVLFPGRGYTDLSVDYDTRLNWS